MTGGWQAQLNLFMLSLCMVAMLWLAVRFHDVRRSNGALLRAWSDFMWVLASFFVLLWFARFDQHADIFPWVDLIGWLRIWLWVPVAALLIAAIRVWRALA
jgi:hypothetical protein